MEWWTQQRVPSSIPTRRTQDNNHKLMMEDDTNASNVVDVANGNANAVAAVEKDDGKGSDGLVSLSTKPTGNSNGSSNSTGSALDVDRTANKGGKNGGYKILGMSDKDTVNVDSDAEDEHGDKDEVDHDAKNDAKDDAKNAATDDTLDGAKYAAKDKAKDGAKSEAKDDTKDDSEHGAAKDIEKGSENSADKSANASVLFQTDDTALLLRLNKDPVMDSKDSPNRTALVLEAAKPPTAVWVNAEHVHPPPLDLTENTSPVTVVAATSSTDYSYCSKTCWIVAIVLVLVSYSILFLAVQLTVTPVPDPQPRETLVTNYINRVKLSPGTLSIPPWRERVSSTTTSEAAALAWLIYNDPLQLSPDNNEYRLRLRQRYALLTLLLQFPDFVANATYFKSTDHECEWESVACETGVESGWRYVGGIAITGTRSSVGSTLSPDLGLLTRLEYIDVSSNALVGSLPSALGPTWSDLESFTVFNNYFTGSLPATMATAWTNLRYMNANQNEFSGSLPSMLGANSTKLHFFHVSDNNLTGTIPSSLNSWDNLFEASFNDNRFVGSVPDSFCMAPTLLADCDEVDCPCCTTCF